MSKPPKMNLRHPLRWKDLYTEAELYKAAVRVYTKPVFQWRKSLSTSTDRKTFYDFAGQEKTFTADEESLRRKHNHIIARVVPTGEEISLSRERIQNLDEEDNAVPRKVERVPQGPTARERQVLAYHKKYKTTSPLYESIRAKYPDW